LQAISPSIFYNSLSVARTCPPNRDEPAGLQTLKSEATKGEEAMPSGNSSNPLGGTLKKVSSFLVKNREYPK